MIEESANENATSEKAGNKGIMVALIAVAVVVLTLLVAVVVVPQAAPKDAFRVEKTGDTWTVIAENKASGEIEEEIEISEGEGLSMSSSGLEEGTVTVLVEDSQGGIVMDGEVALFEFAMSVPEVVPGKATIKLSAKDATGKIEIKKEAGIADVSEATYATGDEPSVAEGYEETGDKSPTTAEESRALYMDELRQEGYVVIDRGEAPHDGTYDNADVGIRYSLPSGTEFDNDKRSADSIMVLPVREAHVDREGTSDYLDIIVDSAENMKLDDKEAFAELVRMFAINVAQNNHIDGLGKYGETTEKVDGVEYRAVKVETEKDGSPLIYEQIYIPKGEIVRTISISAKDRAGIDYLLSGMKVS